MKLEQVQSTLCDILKADPLFTQGSQHIFADDGLQHEAMEDSLKDIGWCVAVSMPMGIATKSQVSAGTSSPVNHGSASQDVLCVISIRTNPKKNRGDTALNVLVAVRSILKAVLSWQPPSGERGFFLPEQRTFEPDFEDVGNVTYDIRVLKNVPL